MKRLISFLLLLGLLFSCESSRHTLTLMTYNVGVFSKYISEISKEEWIKAVEASVPAKFLELNMKAFEMGLAAE